MSGLAPAVSEADHRQGPDEAPVTLVEYGDYECPHCGRAYPIVKEVQKILGRRMRFVFRNFPLAETHPHAARAAAAAEAAAVQYAKKLGLDVERVKKELEAGTHAARVRADFRSGVRSGVNGTPTFFINGRRLDGPWDFEGLMAAIERA